MNIFEAFDESEKHRELMAEVMEEITPDPKKKKKVTKERALDIFTVLKQSDKHNYDYYDTLTDQGKKEFSPWVIQRWLANRKLDLVNDLTNPLIHVVPVELSWRLLCAIGNPKAGRYRWDAPPKKVSGTKTEIVLEVIATHYRVSTRVAKTYVVNLSDEQIMDMADLQGLEKKKITALKKALK